MYRILVREFSFLLALLLIGCQFLPSVLQAESTESSEFLKVCYKPNSWQKEFLEKLTASISLSKTGIDCPRLNKKYAEGQREFLSLTGEGIEDISIIQYFTKLRKLDLSSNQIRDISALTKLTQLEGNSVKGLTPLRGLTNLKKLSIMVRGKIDSLTNLVGLESLKLVGGTIENYDQIAKLTKLTKLNLSHISVKENVCKLNKLVNLERLYLFRTGIADISCLKNIYKLTDLSIINSPLSDISVLRHFPYLQKVNFANTNISNLQVFQRHSDLTEVGIRNTKVTDTSVFSMRGNMRYLETDGSPLESCAPKNSLEANRGYRCTNPDGTRTAWWKRMWQF